MKKSSGKRTRFLPKGLEILHEDRDVLVVEKPAGMLTVATESDRVNTVYYALSDYVRKGTAKSKNRIYVIHRLDRETSGLLVFAKNEQAREQLRQQWPTMNKTFLAVVHGTPKHTEGEISSYLAENRAYKVYSTRDKTKGKWAETSYRLLKQSPEFALLELSVTVLRKHQLRVHLAEAGHPVVGDRKYGREGKRFKRLALHCQQLSFIHPYSGEKCTFSTRRPARLTKLVDGYRPDRPE
ncbi:RluA family pseudouridine synthase [Desulfogranum mediterraneum]|uniref:RluA family pseudouridine synthase n=1 Tax=Desulfogranum mediterraneum TaxID=160661 RepID=UPI000416D3EE|nr:RluA family pseudouridine synthase [Desulfogranum mediterraneum]